MSTPYHPINSNDHDVDDEDELVDQCHLGNDSIWASFGYHEERGHRWPEGPVFCL